MLRICIVYARSRITSITWCKHTHTHTCAAALFTGPTHEHARTHSQNTLRLAIVVVDVDVVAEAATAAVAVDATVIVRELSRHACKPTHTHPHTCSPHTATEGFVFIVICGPECVMRSWCELRGARDPDNRTNKTNRFATDSTTSHGVRDD